MQEIGRELDVVGEAGVLRFERRLDVGKDLPALRVEVVLAHARAALLCRYLAGDEQEFGGLDACDLRVLPERLAQRLGVEKRDLGHAAPSSNAKTHCTVDRRPAQYAGAIVPQHGELARLTPPGSPAAAGARDVRVRDRP